MLTHAGGYPLDAWGSAGYGTGCDDAACVAATIDRLAAHGARVIKLALDDDGLASGARRRSPSPRRTRTASRSRCTR